MPSRDRLTTYFLTASLLGLCSVAQAQTSALAFAQKFKDKFPSEISDPAAFERNYASRFIVEEVFDFEIQYDDSRQRMRLRFRARDRIYHHCRNTGTGQGVTAMGVGMSYTKQTCFQIFLRRYSEVNEAVFKKENEHGDRVFTISATPATYRAIKEKGIEEEVILRPMLVPKGLAIEYARGFGTPKLNDPYEKTVHNYYIEVARVIERRYYLRGAKKPLEISAD